MDILFHHIKEVVVLVVVVVCYGCLEQVAGVVPKTKSVADDTLAGSDASSHFMHIPDIGPAFSGLDHHVMQIQVAIFPLCRPNRLDNVFDRLVKVAIILLSKKVNCGLHPLAKVTVPEEMRWDGPESMIVIDGMPFQLEAVVAAGALQ